MVEEPLTRPLATLSPRRGNLTTPFSLREKVLEGRMRGQRLAGSQQSTVENTNQPKAESFKFKTSYLEPRTLYRHGEAVYLAP